MKKAIAISPEPCVFSDDEVPKGWKLVTILDACEVNPPKPSKDFLPADAPVTFVPMPAVDADKGAITNPDIKPYLEVRNGFTSFRDGDVIIAKITPCMENGKAAIVHGMKNGIGFGSTEFHVMRSRGEILPEYLYYYIRQKSFRNEAESHFTGSVGQKRVPADFIKQSVIPLPPLAEQQHIVARVETLLAHVDAARDRLSRVPLIMKKFRQAVLAAACSGRLTEGWREENLQGFSDQINQKILQKMEKKKILHNFEWAENFTLPSDWILTFIEIVAKVDTGTTPSRKNSDYWDNGSIPWVTSGELYDPFITGTKEKISEIALKETRLKIFPKGTLLIALYGQGITRGKSSELLIEATTNQACGTINVFDDFSPIKSYLKLYLQKNYDDIRKLSTGGVQPNLNLSKIKSMPIPLPPIAEQLEIVRRVGALFERADVIEREVVAASQRCNRLTQAVLGKAFRGELTTNDFKAN